MEKISINKTAINDLLRLKEEFGVIIESLELTNNKEFIDSFKKSKEQVKKKSL